MPPRRTNRLGHCLLPLEVKNVYKVKTVLEIDSWNRLCQHVDCIFRSVNFLQHHLTHDNQFSYLVELQIYVLCPSMIHLVLCQMDGTLAVILQLYTSVLYPELFD
jgi:hypothetical protein